MLIYSLLMNYNCIFETLKINLITFSHNATILWT